MPDRDRIPKLIDGEDTSDYQRRVVDAFGGPSERVDGNTLTRAAIVIGAIAARIEMDYEHNPEPPDPDLRYVARQLDQLDVATHHICAGQVAILEVLTRIADALEERPADD